MKFFWFPILSICIREVNSQNSSSLSDGFNSSVLLNDTSDATIPLCVTPPSSSSPVCSFSLSITPNTHKYIGVGIFFVFIIAQTVHYFCLEDQQAKIYQKEQSDSRVAVDQEPPVPDEEKDRRAKLAYGISTNSYVVSESKTPGGIVEMRVSERRPRRSFAVAPPITPASIGMMYGSRVKTVQKEETQVCQIRVTADKWGRGKELVDLVNDTLEVPALMGLPEEKAKFVMEAVQSHVERMTDQKVFLHGALEGGNPIVCGSQYLEGETFGEARLELKLEVTAPIHLPINVFWIKVEPVVPLQKTAPPVRIAVSELTSVPNKDTPKMEKLPTVVVEAPKMKSTASESLEEAKHVKKDSPETKKKERKDSSKRKEAKKQSEGSGIEVVVIPQPTSQKPAPPREKNVTPRVSPVPTTPEKPSSGQMPPSLVRKKKDSPPGKASSPN